MRVYGLVARISSGQDVDAVVTASHLRLNRSDAELLSSAFLGYLNPNAIGVRAIGELATRSDTDPQVTQNCAGSLQTLHTKESVPYLIHLLDSPSRGVQEAAIQGSSAFATNMRIAKDGADAVEAFDEVMNPARAAQLSKTAPYANGIPRECLHFGPVQDEGEARELVAF